MHAKTGIKEVFMKALRISENVYWVGAIDWNVRNFHGYETEKGTTYNAYLILDEKITLVDTVKDCLQEEMLERIRSVIEPDKIDVIISNHAEPCLLYTSFPFGNIFDQPFGFLRAVSVDLIHR